MSEQTSTSTAGSTGGTEPLATRSTTNLGRSFSSRNPTPIGAIGLVFILLLLFAAFNADKLPLIGGGTSYAAYFADSASLKSGDDVRIAGVRVGKVDSVAIVGGQIKVVFKVKNAWVGDTSTAAIGLKTLLGAKYLDVDSIGSRELPAGGTIPRSRTSSPFDVYPAFTALTDTVQKLNTAQLAKSFAVLSGDFKDTPGSVRPLVDGLSRLSDTIASRDSALRDLLAKTNSVTGVLADRSADLQQLLRDGNLLLQELDARRDAIHSLLVNTTALSQQLEGLVGDNQKTIGPLLDNVNRILATLQDNQADLERGIALLGPFYRVFDNVIGNGRWFDNYIQNFNTTGLVGLSGLGG